MRLLLRHARGELGPKTLDEWATPNGGECLLLWMLRQIEESGEPGVELVQVDDVDGAPDYFVEVRP